MTIDDALKGRDNNFNLVRFLAAFAVLFDHISLASLGPGVHKPVFEQMFGMSLSDLAVNVFFVLSGFLVTKSLVTRSDVVSYVTARFMRLVPGFAVMVAVVTVGLGLYFTSLAPLAYLTSEQTIVYWIGTTLTFTEFGSLPGVYGGNPLPSVANAAIWTLKYEVIAYVALLGLWGVGILQRRALFAFLGSVFVVIALVLIQQPGVHFSPHSMGGAAWASLVRFGLCFFVGAFFYCYRNKISLSGPLAIVGLAASYLVIDLHTYEVVSIVSTGYAVMWVSLVPAGRIRLYNSIGDYSYGIYIWHWPVLQSLIASQPDASFGWLFATTSAITITLAVASWHLIEKPALASQRTIAENVNGLTTWLGWQPAKSRQANLR